MHSAAQNFHINKNIIIISQHDYINLKGQKLIKRSSHSNREPQESCGANSGLPNMYVWNSPSDQNINVLCHPHTRQLETREF